jgi:hypothetical protein
MSAVPPKDDVRVPDPSTPEPAKPTDAGKAAMPAPTTISNLADLKEVAPKFYQESLKAMGREMCKKLQHSADRLKKIRREAER